MRVRALLLTALMGLSGCGDQPATPSISASDTACQSGVAQIAVRDGQLQRLCGCAETDTTPIAPPATLNCTVSSGTTVAFHYFSTSGRHQIVPTGGSTFTASALHDADAERPYRTHVVRLTTPGTYGFMDAFNSAVTGRVIVP